MIKQGMKLYHNEPTDKRAAFDLISTAMQIGLRREQSHDDHPGFESGELVATWYIAVMLLDDAEGIVSRRTEPFWFEEKTPETRSDVEQILQYVLEGNLKPARDIAWSIVYRLGFGDRGNDYAEELYNLLRYNIKVKPSATYTLYKEERDRLTEND
jgi:hypothetical protein